MEKQDRERFDAFVDSCRVGGADFRLTPCAEPSAYARCFGVFNLWLMRRQDELARDRTALVDRLLADLSARRGHGPPPTDKAYRQLLAFTLSALAILNSERDPAVASFVVEQVPGDIETMLRNLGCLDGRMQSGNQAMFLAVFLLHAHELLGQDTGDAIARWVELHLQSQNRFGFWGGGGLTHLLFQNGYHQYEILERLGVPNPRRQSAVESVRRLVDDRGHFAPYPGGGGCYDYDAVFVLTPDGHIPDEETGELLDLTYRTVLSEQRIDGGFAENLSIRPRLRNVGRMLRRAAASDNTSLRKERLRYALALQRPKHDRVITHWSLYQRRWDESNLWDSYFRMLLIARIESARDPASAASWGFIDYPGIGWHPSLRRPATSGAAQKSGEAAA